MKYDVLVYNAKIYSLEDTEDIYHNMLVKDGKVAMLVRENYIPDDIDVQKDIRYLIDGRGRVIIPSFIVTDIYLPFVAHAYAFEGKEYLEKNQTPESIRSAVLQLSRAEYTQTVDRIINAFVSNGITASKPLCSNSSDKLNNKLIKDCSRKYKGYMAASQFPETGQLQIDKIFYKSYDEIIRDINPLSAITQALKENYLSSEINPFILLKKYTHTASKELGIDNKKGLLKEGYDADFIKLNKNPFEIDKGSFQDVNIISTYVSSAKMLAINNSKKGLFNNLFNL